jgi:hypothetical protein
MKRHLLNLLAALSLLLCVGVVAPWVWSYRFSTHARWNSIEIDPSARLRCDSLLSSSGRIGWTREDTRLLEDGPPSFQWFNTPAREFGRTPPKSPPAGTWTYRWISKNNGAMTLDQFSLVGLSFTSESAGDSHRIEVWLPYWFLMSALATPAAVRFFIRLRRKRRLGPGVCGRCGYDLRATPGRCPECGATAGGARAA